MAITLVRDEQLKNGALFIKKDGTVAFTSDQSMGGFKLTNIATPANPGDAATKSYVDATSQGLDVKNSVKVATTANITLSGVQTIDGVVLSAGDRVLVKNQTVASANGIYAVAAGAWTRSADADADAEVTTGLFTFVEEGTANGISGWVLNTTGAIVVGTTALAFTQFSGAGQVEAGNGLVKTGNTLDVNVAAAGSVQIVSDALEVKLDGTSLVSSSSGLKVNAASKFIVRETPSGSVDGSNTSFTLANTPLSGKEEVFLNGVLQEPGAGNDYTIAGAVITYLTAPLSGDRLRVSYLIA